MGKGGDVETMEIGSWAVGLAMGYFLSSFIMKRECESKDLYIRSLQVELMNKTHKTDAARGEAPVDPPDRFDRKSH